MNKVLLFVLLVIFGLPALEVVCNRIDMTRPTVIINKIYNFLSSWANWFGYQIAVWLDWAWMWQRFKDLLDWLFRDYINAFEDVYIGLFRYFLIPYEFIKGYDTGLVLTYAPSFNAVVGGFMFIILLNLGLNYQKKRNNAVVINVFVITTLVLSHTMMVLLIGLY